MQSARVTSAVFGTRRFCPEAGSLQLTQCTVRLNYYILSTGETHFSRGGVHNTNSLSSHATVESSFPLLFSFKVWCAFLYNQMNGPFIFEGRLTRQRYLRFRQEEFPNLLKYLAFCKGGRFYFQRHSQNKNPTYVSGESYNK